MAPQSQYTSRRSSRIWLAVLAALIGLLAAYSVVYASLITINTDDGAVDAAWASNPYTQLVVNHPRNLAISGQNDIKNAWFANDGTYITWRIQAYSSTIATSGHVVVGVLDCNLNNSFDDYVDRKLVFNPNTDDYIIYRGSETLPLNFPPKTNSERIGDSVEMKVIWANMDPWCYQTNSNRTRIGFAIAASGGSIDDQVGPFDWSVPTSVTLNEFNGTSGGTTMDVPYLIAALVMMIVAGLVVWPVYRRRTIGFVLSDHSNNSRIQGDL